LESVYKRLDLFEVQDNRSDVLAERSGMELSALGGIAATLLLLTIAGFLCGAIAATIAAALQAVRVTLAATREEPAGLQHCRGCLAEELTRRHSARQ
jgi:hypothetical protein